MISQNPFDDTRDYDNRASEQTFEQDFPESDLADPEFENSELISIFDRYSSALDSGDEDAAEAILKEYPEIGDEFREPLRGLYLLGQGAKQQKLDNQFNGKEGRKQLGDFEIENELGRGGMGIVYAATQISLQRPVALKILPFTAVLDPKQVARFRNEAQAAASLHHPNIVPVFGVGCERGVHYYSMQLIEGQSLEQFIDQLKGNIANDNGPCDHRAETAGNLSTVVSYQSPNYIHNVIQIGSQIAEALDFAHEQGVVHRDIKPSNLLLDQSGKIWVADFGLAQCRGNSNLTSQGDRLGTARYMSPEQAAGRTKQVDYRSDVYSLGVTLYELLTLRPAFDAPDRIQLMAAIESERPVHLRKINPAIPVDLETVIEKAISKDPADRYESAQTFADDLSRCFNGEPIHAKRLSWLERMAKSALKHKKTVAAAGLIVTMFALTATFMASTFYNQRVREHAAAANARFYLRQAHSVVDRFSGHVFDELRHIPGTESLQADLVLESIGYYDKFLEFAKEAPGLNFEQAIAYSQLAQLREKTGQNDLAEEYYETSISLLDELKKDSTTDSNANFNVALEQAVCFDRMALLDLRAGKSDECSQHLESALSRFREIESESEGNARTNQVIAAYAQTLANAGTLEWIRGNEKGARAYFENSLAKLNSQQKELLEDPGLRSAYFKVNGAYTGILIELNSGRAETVLRDSISGLAEANERLDQHSNRDNLAAENLEHIADMHNNLAIVLLQKGDLNAATAHSKKAVMFWESQISRVPDSLLFSQRLATALNTLGEIAWQKGSKTLGDDSFSKAESLLRKIIDRAPNRPDSISRLAGVLHNRSLVAYRNQSMPEAEKLITQAIQNQSAAMKLVPENVKYQQLLKSHEKTHSAFLANTSSTPKKGG